MATKIVNLTRQNVDRKIEQFLSQNSEFAKYRVSSSPDLQRQLTTYVLNRVDNCYAAVEGAKVAGLNETLNPDLQGQRLESLIQQGLETLLPMSPDDAKQPATVETGFAHREPEPSHWFG